MRHWLLFALLLAVAPLTASLAGAAVPVSGESPGLSPVSRLAPPQHPPVTLVAGGVPRLVIVADTQAEQGTPAQFQSVTPAVQALREAFLQTTGHEVRTVEVRELGSVPAGTPRIIVGANAASAALGVDPAALPPEGFVVRSFDRGLAIVGCDGSLRPGFYRPDDRLIQHFRLCGTLWGALDFCERFLGVRYYYPGLGVVTPPCRDLLLAPLHYTDHPVYAERTMWNYWLEFGRQGETWPWDKQQVPVDFAAFRDRWRIANASRFVAAHTPNRWAAVHGQDQPELFYRDPAGKLWLDPASFAGNMYDVSRRETAEQYIADCKRFYQSGWVEPWKDWHCPNSRYIPFGLPDNYVVVENERTKNLLNPDLGRFGVMSDVMAQFHVWLAEAAARELPGKTVTGYAYATYRLPPQRQWRFPANFELQQCHFSQLGMFVHPRIMEYELGVTRAWAQRVGKPVRTYVYLSGEQQEYPMLGELAALPEYFRRFGPYLSGVCFDGGGAWARSHLSLYLAYRLAWNPRFDVTAALEEYHRLMYGAAAEPMERLTATMTDCWREYQARLDPTSPMVHVDRDQVYGRVFPPEIREALQADLAAARAAVPADSPEAKRVAFVAEGYRRFFEQGEAFSNLKRGVFEAPRVADKAITVDGVLDEAAWGQTRPFELHKPLTGGPVVFPSSGKVVWTGDSLYLGFSFAEYDPKALRVVASDHDGHVYDDDSIEIVLSPGEQKEQYYHLAVNPAGIVYDSRTVLQPARGPMDAAWNWEGLQARTTVGDKSWQVELRLPCAALGLTPPPAIWHANFIRNKLTLPRETQSFSPTMGNNHDERYWGLLRLTGPTN